MDTGGEHTQALLQAMPGVRVHVVAALSTNGGLTPASLAAGVEACEGWRDVGAVVIASSWPARPPGAEAVEAAIAHQRSPVLVAAGNRGTVEFPATVPGVVAIGAVDDDGHRCGFSPPVAVTARGCGAEDPDWGTSVAVARAAVALLRWPPRPAQ
ncbi:MAG: Subtilase family [Conexibacter sp.]|nr:Subtilase family [Conexibacter sp.]